MLSICIAIYNYDVTALVNDLCKQARELGIVYEVILIDDASLPEYQQKNETLGTLPNISYIVNNCNTGRSAIRNSLAQKAQYPYLLFMDCDTRITHADYLQKYWAAIETAQVIAGGYEYPATLPDKNCFLRWSYGTQREISPAKIRNKNPNFSFSTFNFLIEKAVFNTIQFDETLQGYGHEDTLFGLDLLANGVIVKHIDNPLCHQVVATNDKFLAQTENSINNLWKIFQKIENKELFLQSNKLLRTFFTLKKFRCVSIFRCCYFLLSNLILNNLHSTCPKMRFFDLYKLHYLCRIAK